MQEYIENYTVLFKSLNLSDAAISCLTGNLILPRENVLAAPFKIYGFPPALLPVWSNGDFYDYEGFWLHWFLNREITFVTYYSEITKVTETARDFGQICRIQLANIIGAMSDDEVLNMPDDITNFAKDVGIHDLDELILLARNVAESPDNLVKSEYFSNRAPIDFIFGDDIYTGSFPDIRSGFNVLDLNLFCSIEFDSELLSNNEAEFPARYTQSQVQAAFYNALESNDLSAAWLSLNSRGWKGDEAIDGIVALEKIADNPDFSLLVKAWLSANSNITFHY